MFASEVSASAAAEVAPSRRALSVASRATLAVATLIVGTASQFAFTNEEFFHPKSFAYAAGALVCAFLVARHVVRFGMRLDALDGIVLAYLALGLVSWTLGGGPAVDLLDWLGRDGPTAIVFLSVALAVVGGGPKTGGARQHERLILIVALVLAGVALAEARGATFPFEAIRRPGSLLGNRNFVGAYLAIALPFACAFALEDLAWWKLAPVAVLVTTVLISRCRSAWVGLLLAAAVSAGFTSLRRTRWTPTAKRGALALAASVAIGGAFASMPWPGLHWREDNPIVATAARLLDYEEGSGRVRVTQMQTAFDVARSSVLGRGPGSWDDAENTVRPSHDWRLNPTPSSDLARILAELGFVGVAISGAGIALLFVRGARAVRASESLDGLAPLAALVVCTVHAVLDAPLFRPPLAVLLATVAGLVRASAAAPGRSLESPAARGTASIGVVGLGIAGLVSPLLVLVASLRGGARGDVEVIAASQRIYPREYVSEYVAKTLVAAKKCDEAEPEIERLRRWGPHHTGPLHLGAECARDRGDEATAQRLEAEAAELAAHDR